MSKAGKISLMVQCCLLLCGIGHSASFQPLLFMRPNETPMFTELYQRYGLLNPPALHVYDTALYLGQPGKGSTLHPSSDNFFKNVDQNLQAYHRRLGSLDLFLDPKETKATFCPTNGSLQTIFGLVHAIATAEPQKRFLFVEKIPYYSFHEHALSYRPHPNARFQGFHEPQEITLQPGETLVEFVTSPNNPDGQFRHPYTEAKIIIADFVFASPSYGSDGTGYLKENLAWVSKARSERKHVFAFNSVSKALGKPGYRLGYIWFPMSDSYAASIFHDFFAYAWKLTVGTSTSGVAQALDLMSAIQALPQAGQALRQDAFHTIVKRHQLVSAELRQRYPGTEIVSIPGSPTLYAKLHSPDLKTMTGEDIIFRDLNTTLDNGTSMGSTPDFIRVNLCGYSGDMAEFLNRLANSKKYQASELLLTKANHCTERVITNAEVLNPNDCSVAADAKNADIVITLPAFINYQQSNIITIKKTDNSNHAILVKTDTFEKRLNKPNEQVRLQWKQPFFLRGEWQLIH